MLKCRNVVKTGSLLSTNLIVLKHESLMPLAMEDLARNWRALALTSCTNRVLFRIFYASSPLSTAYMPIDDAQSMLGRHFETVLSRPSRADRLRLRVPMARRGNTSGCRRFACAGGRRLADERHGLLAPTAAPIIGMLSGGRRSWTKLAEFISARGGERLAGWCRLRAAIELLSIISSLSNLRILTSRRASENAGAAEAGRQPQQPAFCSSKPTCRQNSQLIESGQRLCAVGQQPQPHQSKQQPPQPNIGQIQKALDSLFGGSGGGGSGAGAGGAGGGAVRLCPPLRCPFGQPSSSAQPSAAVPPAQRRGPQTGSVRRLSTRWGSGGHENW
uniref:ADF-H domain-containing protein n=1 Tax=Macrostomum lignano TaxID=282301 RepID=A0A1I8FF38_9PLAT